MSSDSVPESPAPKVAPPPVPAGPPIQKATTAGNYFVSNYPPFGFWKPEFLPEMVGLLQKHQTLEESQNAVTGHLGLARAQLKSLPDSESAAGLSALADYLAYQTESLGVRG